jgi:hypothetical protein
MGDSNFKHGLKQLSWRMIITARLGMLCQLLCLLLQRSFVAISGMNHLRCNRNRVLNNSGRIE